MVLLAPTYESLQLPLNKLTIAIAAAAAAVVTSNIGLYQDQWFPCASYQCKS